MTIHLVKSAEEIVEAVRNADIVTLDCETSSKYPWRDGRILAGLGIKPLSGDSYYASFRHGINASDEDNIPLWELETICKALRGKTIVGHNILKFDFATLWQDQQPELVESTNIIDTIVTTRLVYEDEPSYELKWLAAHFIDDNANKYKQALGKYIKSNKLKHYGEVPAQEILAYVEKDLEYAEWLYVHTMPIIIKRNLEALLVLEQRVARALFDIERHGCLLDISFIEPRLKDITKESKQANTSCFTLVEKLLTERWRGRKKLTVVENTALNIAIELFKEENKAFGIQNPTHVRKLFHGMGAKSGVKTDKGGESWDKDALEVVASTHEDTDTRNLAATIVHARSLLHVLSIYESFIELADKDSVLHPSINQAGAKTGRMSMSEPNLQNVPKRESLVGARSIMAVVTKTRGRRKTVDTDDDEETSRIGEVRGAFVPRKGCFLLMADWSQIELRILADFAREPSWLRAFDLGLDIHEVSAHAAYGDPPDDPILRKWWRKLGKVFGFGIVYGIGKKKLGKQINRTESEAGDFRKAFFTRNPRIQRFLYDSKERCELRLRANGKHGWVRNLWNRRRYLTEDKTYKAPNFLIQGTAADFLKDTTWRLYLALEQYNARIINIIHDEFIFEIPYEEAADVIPKIVYEMQTSDRITVPIKVDLKWSPTRWSEAQALDCADCAGSGKTYDRSTQELFTLLVNDDNALNDVKWTTCTKCDGQGYSINAIVKELARVA